MKNLFSEFKKGEGSVNQKQIAMDDNVTFILEYNDYPFYSKVWIVNAENNLSSDKFTIRPEVADQILKAVDKGKDFLRDALKNAKLNTLHNILQELSENQMVPY